MPRLNRLSLVSLCLACLLCSLCRLPCRLLSFHQGIGKASLPYDSCGCRQCRLSCLTATCLGLIGYRLCCDCRGFFRYPLPLFSAFAVNCALVPSGSAPTSCVAPVSCCVPVSGSTPRSAMPLLFSVDFSRPKRASSDRKLSAAMPLASKATVFDQRWWLDREATGGLRTKPPVA